MRDALLSLGEPTSRAGRFPEGGHPGTSALTSPTPSGSGSRTSSPTAPTRAAAATPGRTIAPWSTASSGTCTRVPLGPIRQDATAPGRPSTIVSTAGARTAPGPRSSTPCCSASTSAGSLTATCGWSMLPSSALRGLQPGRKKNPAAPPRLAGPEAMQVQEPQDHALGRSQGGFGTKVHLVCDGHGILLAVWVTPGQRHESQAFAIVMLRAKRPRRAGRRRWPLRVGADKGYSYDGLRAWLRRRHIGGVIPTR